MSSFVERTGERMRERIAGYQAGERSLRALVADLEALIASLEGEAPAALVADLQSAWWPLEMAVAQGDEQRAELDAACADLLRLLAPSDPDAL